MSQIEFEPVLCGQCETAVAYAEREPRIPCAVCGSTARKFGVIVAETIQARSSLAMKAKHDAATGKHKWYLEQFEGWSLHRDSGQYRKVSQIVDRENDRYRKLVTDEDGRVVRDVDEALTAHRGRGDAKHEPEKV